MCACPFIFTLLAACLITSCSAGTAAVHSRCADSLKALLPALYSCADYVCFAAIHQTATGCYCLQEVESEGVRLVREGRAARLAAVQQQLADGSSNRDQQLLEARGSSDYGGAGGAGGYSSSGSGGRTAFGRLSPGRNALRGAAGREGRSSSLAGSISSMSGAERASSAGGGDWQSTGGQTCRQQQQKTVYSSFLLYYMCHDVQFG